MTHWPMGHAMTLDQARRLIAFSDSPVLVAEAKAYVESCEIEAQIRYERYFGFDD